jgi:hypothetical protein
MGLVDEVAPGQVSPSMASPAQETPNTASAIHGARSMAAATVRMQLFMKIRGLSYRLTGGFEGAADAQLRQLRR